MEPMKFYFDVRDIFRAPRLALSGKKIWVFLKANLIGLAIYWIFTYLAMVVNGNNIAEMIQQFGLYPCIYGVENTSIFSHIIYWIGVATWVLLTFFACTGVSRITYKQLKGDDFYSISDTYKFVKNHRIPIFMSWISVLLIALFFVVGAVIFALIGKIPFIGEILFALLYIFYFFGAVFTIYTLVVFFVSFIYSPSIVATMEEDSMGTVFQSYSITWSQPWRIVLYHLVLIPIVGVGVHILKMFWLAGYKFINIIFGANWLMGEKLRNITGWATDLINPGLKLCCDMKSCGNSEIHSLLSLQEGVVLSTSGYIAGTILAIMLFIILFSIISYGLSIMSVGETIIFTILKKKTNDDNLLEHSDKDDIEDEENDENGDQETEKDTKE